MLTPAMALGSDLMTSTFGKVRSGSTGNGVAPQSLGIPVAAYPGRVATNSDLIVAVDRQQTQLALPLNATDTSMTVGNAALIVPYCLLSIDAEIVKVTGPPAGNVVPISRGFDGTIAALHLAGSVVSGFVDAWHHNALVAEIEAIEQTLGPNLSRVPTSPFVVSTFYDFVQTPGGNLNPGTNQITLVPVPLGINGTDQLHYLYISGGTGTPEAVMITGGTAVPGASSGTIFVTCVNSHSGSWTIRSATAGIQEAVNSLPGFGKVYIPTGNYNIYAGIYIPVAYTGTYFEGFGESATRLNIAANANNSQVGFFGFSGYIYNVGGIRGLSINFVQPDSTNVNDYTQWKPAIYFADGGGLKIQDVLIQAAWVGVYGVSCNGMDISNLRISSIYRSVWVDYSADSVNIRGLHVYSAYGLTNNQALVMSQSNYGLSVGQVDDLQVSEYTAGTALAFYSYTSTTTGGSTFGNLSNCDFDTYGGVFMADGIIQIVNVQFSPTGTARGVFQIGGVLKLDAIRIFNMSSHPAIETAFSVRMKRGTINTDATISVENSWIYNQSDEWFVSSSTASDYTGNANTAIVNNQLEHPTNVTYANPAITINEATGTTNRATIIGNRVTPVGSGTAIWVALGADEAHVVTGNSAPGLAASLPPTGTLQKTLIDFPATTAAVASASAITPTGPLFHVTGAAAINAITTPAGFPYKTFTIIPDGAFTLVASPTIGRSANAVVGQAMTLTKDVGSGVWYPSYA